MGKCGVVQKIEISKMKMTLKMKGCIPPGTVKLHSKVQISVLGLGVDFVLPLSQQQQEEQQQQPLTKIYQKGEC